MTGVRRDLRFGRRGSLRRALACSATAAFLLGCTQTPPPETAAPAVPPQHDAAPPVAVAIIPDDISSTLLNGYSAEAANFYARTLETAPDGATRHWQSLDRATTLIVQPRATQVTATLICREVAVQVVTAHGRRDFELRACRLQNGLWTH